MASFYAFLIFYISMSFIKADVTLIETPESFTEILKSDVMVKFYAPWCGHCKKLAPEYVKAEKALKEEPVKLAEVDCTKNSTKSICEKYDVHGYPNIKFFRKSPDDPIEYEGARVSDQIVSFVKKAIKDAVQSFKSSDELEKFLKENPYSIIEFSESPSKKFSKIAESLKLEHSFAHSADKTLASTKKVAFPSIVAFRDFDEPIVEYKESKGKTRLNLKNWVKDLSFPHFGELGAHNYQKYIAREKPILWVSVDKGDKKKLAEIQEIGSKVFSPLRKKLLGIFIDGKTFRDALKDMGFGDSFPNAMIINKDEKYKFDGEFTEERISKFAKDYLDGKASRFFKSQKVPEKNEGPLFDVVGSNFESFTKDKENDVVVEFYLSYCKYCKELEPKYKEVAEKFKNDQGIKIARINVGENDVPEKINGFPTIKMYRQDKEPLTFDGDRSAKSIEEWITKHSTMLSSKETEKKKEAAGEKEEL